MPSGITAPIYDNKPITPKEFVLRCAEQFGYGGDHDFGDGSDNVVRERRYLKEALQELATLQAMDADAKVEGAMKSYFSALDSWVDSKKRNTPRRLRYEKMKAAIQVWDASEEGAKRVKDYAIEQLDQSIAFDCSDWPSTVPEMEDPAEWYAQRLEWAERRLIRAREDVAAAIERHERSIAWRDAFEADLEKV